VRRPHLFPVRHHSPRTSVVLRGLLERVQPALVLVEGPPDADGLVGVLADPETVPPVAILAYRTDGVTGSVMWPFAEYSPEYVAVKWAVAHGVPVRFVDITAAQSLALAPEPPEPNDEISPYTRVAEASGLRSFEEFWEASFEAPAYDEDAFHTALLAFADLVRHGGSRVGFHRARDAVMLAAIEAAAGEGTPPDRIVAVLGAAHAAALAADDVDRTLAGRFSAAVPTALTVIPYSFPRLAEQYGYGAGNRAPYFYQRAHTAGGDYRRAALEVLVDFTDHLRLRGFSVSLADTIEAYRLACMLGEIRGKSGPGLDEVREATVATLCRGDQVQVDQFLWSTVIGKGVGQVAKGIGRNSLQEEFWATVARHRLARTDEAEAVALRLADPSHVEISTFLHRLRILEIPYAALADTAKGALEGLSRVREAWQCQWTPATEVALVQVIVHGESFPVACERWLGQRVLDATSVGAAGALLVDAVVAEATAAVGQALAAVERLAAHDDAVPSLAAACRALAGLVAYGSNRAGADEHVLQPLLVKMFTRATLRLSTAAEASDEDAPAITEAMRVLHELALSQPTLDQATWVEALRELGHSFVAHPRCAGTAAGLLVLSRLWSDEELDSALRLRLSDPGRAGRTADYLVGLLEVNALAIVRNAEVIAILDTYLQGLAEDDFRATLPALRRAFAELGKTERRYLVENIVALRGHAGGAAADAVAVVTARDQEQLRAVSDEIAAAMDDLDDLL
jgi:Family of unknown function (DUF5682)